MLSIKEIVDYRAKATRLAGGESPETVIYTTEEAAHRLGIEGYALVSLINDGIVTMPPVDARGKWILSEAYCQVINDSQSEAQSDVTQSQTEEDTAILRTPGPQAGDSSAEGGSQGEADGEATEAEGYDDDGYTERLDAVDARIDTLDARVDSIDSRVSIAMSMHDDAVLDDSSPIAVILARTSIMAKMTG